MLAPYSESVILTLCDNNYDNYVCSIYIISSVVQRKRETNDDDDELKFCEPYVYRLGRSVGCCGNIRVRVARREETIIISPTFATFFCI
jgi:hypothetical protein